MTQSPFTTPTRLVGDLVVVEPLQPAHHDGLVEAVRDGELWQHWYTRIPTPESMAEEIAARLAKQEAGQVAAFTVRAADTGQVLGMTTYLHPDEPNRRLEVGSTWLRASAQGTGANAETKLLLLAHAFEVLGCEAVEFRAHHLNQQSRAAIERLGAHLDGVLRRHVLLPNGTWRDTCVYSVLAQEWPAVRAGLRARLARRLPD
ncbi:GNAT family N-acetyltransferase [Propionibacteriaceae bacterium Y1923]|uniref:GNAT family N-acetyltransferase n=1 Tax=Aestuariimicrobium sp. Y1814 TaxID=3418742 RepID=UPI003C27C99F